VNTVARRRLRNVTVAAVVGVSVVAWAGGAQAVGAQEQPDACALFTRKEAKRILGTAARRETNVRGTQGSECSYTAEKDAKRVVGFAVGDFPSDADAKKAYTRARVNAQFDGLVVQNVRRLGQRAHWLPMTNNFERTVLDEKLVIGELTVLQGRRIYTVYVAPPAKKTARDAINLVIAD
jgi:hypothetical protein